MLSCRWMWCKLFRWSESSKPSIIDFNPQCSARAGIWLNYISITRTYVCIYISKICSLFSFFLFFFFFFFFFCLFVCLLFVCLLFVCLFVYFSPSETGGVSVMICLDNSEAFNLKGKQVNSGVCLVINV